MNKFIKALARHELAIKALSEATAEISRTLNECPIQKELDKHYDLQWQGGGYWNIEQLTDDMGRTKTHLWSALNTGPSRRYDDEVTEYLAEEETGCPHCAKAWELINHRKKARQELGVARRLIRYYGKLALLMVADDDN